MRSFWLIAALLSIYSLANAQTPVINAGGIVNTGSYSTGGVSPGSIVSIFGTNLADKLTLATRTPLSTSLGNVQSVTFNGVPAGLYFVSSMQINAQVPWNVSVGNVSVVVKTSVGSSAPQTVTIVGANPGIFTISANGLGQAVASDNNDGAVAAATGSIPGLVAHPIHVGDYLVLWCTGLGAVDTQIENGGTPGGRSVNTVLKPTVLIGGVSAPVAYSMLSQYVGEYQLAVQVPSNAPVGFSVSVQIQVNGVTTSNAVTIDVVAAVTVQDASCTLTSTSCIAIDLNFTDPYSTSGNFSGYADPSIRQDPQTGTLWMAYSWPHSTDTPSGVTQTIDLHLAYSTDGGKNWQYKGPLFTAAPFTNPVTGATDYTSYEVMNILPQVVNGTTYWYGIHVSYLIPQGLSGSGNEDYSLRWSLAMAPGDADSGPIGLATAPQQYLGQSINTDPSQFPFAVNLSTIESEVNSCIRFYEPAMAIYNDNLYLFLSCLSNGGQSAGFYALYKTPNPEANAPNWNWTYVPQGPNKFANASDAKSVARVFGSGANATYLTQMDIAPGRQPGTLLAIATAAYNVQGKKQSFGCVAAEMANVDPPRFIYDTNGQVVVDAFITSPDSTATGPGSCTYSPASATGMIMAHRQTNNSSENGGFFTFLMQSFLFP